MLSEIRITGLGVIEDATLDLDPGFTAVTGETGAGKTMAVRLRGRDHDCGQRRTEGDRATGRGPWR